jgi:peptidoglycan/LPS O-acetylase OafA/YrhL
MVTRFCQIWLDRSRSVFCFEWLFNFITTFRSTKTRTGSFIQTIFSETVFQNCSSFSVYCWTLFLFPIFSRKRKFTAIMDLFIFHSKPRIKLKRFWHIFSCLVALCGRTFLFTLTHYLNFTAIHAPPKKSYWLILVLFLAGFAFRGYSFNQLYLPKIETDNSWVYWYKYIYYPTYNRLDGLLVGVSIAGLYQFRPVLWAKISQYGNLHLVLSLIILTGAYFLCFDQMTFNASIWGFPLIAIGYGCMVVGAVSPTSFLYKWKSKTTSLIAALSYAIYLTHKGVIHTTHEILNGITEPNLMLLVCTVTCIIFACLVRVLIEKPFMQLRNRIVKDK